jgi:hypothetical protein
VISHSEPAVEAPPGLGIILNLKVGVPEERGGTANLQFREFPHCFVEFLRQLIDTPSERA